MVVILIFQKKIYLACILKNVDFSVKFKKKKKHKRFSYCMHFGAPRKPTIANIKKIPEKKTKKNTILKSNVLFIIHKQK